ncbi:DUF4834 family protein [Sunxiuqinia sp. A32]|uniref:DUF4834 family protein n=1 Tax=Sunxiuqinia sp. A32 TaxID=3461496 RepID=UPI0040464ADF
MIRFVTKVLIPLFTNQPNSQGNFQRQEKQREGDVTIESDRRKDSHFSKDEGEYVDFEEID